MEKIIKSLKFQIISLEEQIEKDTDRLDELRIKLFKLTGGNEVTK